MRPRTLPDTDVKFSVDAVRPGPYGRQRPSRPVASRRAFDEGVHVGDMREIASGLHFPEGPVALADGSVLVVEIQSGTLARGRARRDGRARRRHGRRTQRRRHRARRQGLRVQQRRLRVGRGRRHGRARRAAARLHRRSHPAGRPRHGRGRGPLHRVRRASASAARTTSCSTSTAASTSRTSASPARARSTEARVYYAKADGSRDRAARLPARPPQRHRTVARRDPALRRRDDHRAHLDLATGRARRGGAADHAVRPGHVALQLRRLPAARLDGRRQRRQHLRGDARHRARSAWCRPTASCSSSSRCPSTTSS